MTAPRALRNFINGEFCDARSERRLDVVNPATGKVVATAPVSSARDVDDAYAAAAAAFGEWGRTTPSERQQALLKFADAIEARADEFVTLEGENTGKPHALTASEEVPPMLDQIRFFAGAARVLEGKAAGEYMKGHTSWIRREPIGVVGQVTPWNYPMMMAVWKIAPALAAGNTVVLKPAETTPLTALLFAQICQQADLPPGVINIVTGAGATGQAIVDHPGIDKIAFTGSTRVGKMIAREIAGTRKRATLELGGKAANIVFDDAPLDQTIEGIVNGIFFNQGQVCCAGSRLLVQESIADDVERRLKRRLATLRVGDPMDKNTDVGAINSRRQLDRITELSAAGEAEGAARWDTDCPLPKNGFWFRPTVFTGVSQSHRIAQEEIFGPVLSVLTFRTPAEAVAKANNTPYGLSAGVWTEKGSRILWMADQLRAGVVWANTFNQFDPTSPFGGYKESGYGREGGRHGLEAYVRTGGAA